MRSIYDQLDPSCRRNIGNHEKKLLVDFFFTETSIGSPIRRLYLDMLASITGQEKAKQLVSCLMGIDNLSVPDRAKWEDFARAMWESVEIADRASIFKPIEAYEGFENRTQYTREWPPRTKEQSKPLRNQMMP